MNNSPTVPKGYQLDDIQNEIKAQKNLKDQNIDNLFDGKGIFIETSNYGKSLRINILPENEPSLSQISTQFLKGEYCLTGVCVI